MFANSSLYVKLFEYVVCALNNKNLLNEQVFVLMYAFD